MDSRIYIAYRVSPAFVSLFCHFGLIVTHLALNKVANTRLGHHGDSHGLHDLLDHAGIGHASHAALDTDVGRDPLEGHDGGGTGFFGDAGLERGMLSGYAFIMVNRITHLLGIDHVHDHATLQHLG